MKGTMICEFRGSIVAMRCDDTLVVVMTLEIFFCRVPSVLCVVPPMLQN